MTDRRSFLGSVIGMVGGAVFLAKLPDQTWMPPACKNLPYKALMRDSASGLTIQAPSIIEILSTEAEGVERGPWKFPPFSHTFICDAINVTRTLNLDQAILIDKHGKFNEQKLYYPIVACSGDQIKLHVTLATDRLIALEETIKLHRRKLA